MKNKFKTNLDSLDEKIPVYLHYSGQTQPQSAHVDIHPDGYLIFEANSEIGNAIPISVWVGWVIRIDIPNNLTKKGISDWVADHEDDISTVISAMDDHFDGSNWRGGLTDEADIVLGSLRDSVYDGYDSVDIVDAEDYLHVDREDILKRIESGEKNLEENIRRECEMNSNENIYIVGLGDFLEEIGTGSELDIR